MVAPFRYGPSFQYAGDYTDNKDLDIFRRRKTRVIAIDAMPDPGMGQYKLDALIREVNKAFSGYMHQCKYNIDVKHDPEASSSVRPQLCSIHEFSIHVKHFVFLD
jgi:poly(ADP-ribose) glycohydrolase